MASVARGAYPVIVLSERLLDTGVYRYEYSPAPGHVITVTALPGPDRMPAGDPQLIDYVRAIYARYESQDRRAYVPD